MVPWSKAFMSYRGRAGADRILKSFHNVRPSSSTSSSSKIPSPSWKLIHLLIIFVMNVRKCSLLWAALHLREEIMTAGENSPSPLLYFIPTSVFAETYHFCFIITFRLDICQDRHDQRSSKKFSSCVNFSRKQQVSIWNLHWNMKLTDLFGKFTHLSLRTIEILQFIS